MGMMQEFQKAGKERQAEVAAIRSGVAAMRSGVATILKEFAKQSDKRRADVTNYMSSEVGNIRSEVATMLKEFAKRDAERRSEIATIRSGVATMRSGVATMLKGLAKEDAERKSRVTDYMRSEVAAIHEMVWGKAPARKAAPPVEKVPKQVPPQEAVVEEAPLAKLRDKVFAYLADHPDGTKLTELEEEFGITRLQLARVIRALMDDNKVEKRELLYFAI